MLRINPNSLSVQFGNRVTQSIELSIMELSIIIPAYNEEKRISKTLGDYYSYFNKEFKDNFEIIIIPNNCSDNTFEIIKKFSKNRKNIQIHNIPYYAGKGGAVMKGFSLANGKLIGFADADNSTNPENFYKLYKNIGNSEGIIASRKIKGAVINPSRRFSQDFSSAIFNIFVKILFNLKYKDTQCGAKLFRRDIAKYLAENITEKGWAFDVDVLYLCKKNKFKMIEYPIFWSDSEGSKLSFADGMNSVIKLIKYRMKN
jgi:glycosyltransferase involved in cell wall biosynthesis